MGDISKYLSRREFACKCGCGLDAADAELLALLNDVRQHFGRPVIITSGNRCRAHNAAVGGEDHSQHMLCKAADFRVHGIAPVAVYAYLDTKYHDSHGFGLYNSWTHADVRREKARWTQSA